MATTDKKAPITIRFPSESSNLPFTYIAITKRVINPSEVKDVKTPLAKLLAPTKNANNDILINLWNGLKGEATNIFAGVDQMWAISQAEITKDILYLAIPLPNDISTSYSANWNGHSLTPTEYFLRQIISGVPLNSAIQLAEQRAGLEFTKNIIGRGLKKVSAGVSGKISEVTKGKVTVPTIEGKNSAVGGAVINSIERGVGVTNNPYRELLYDAPNFRQFTFTWNLSPKNFKESEDINRIIFYLKKHMHPDVFGEGAEDSLLFLYPDMVTMEFMTKDSENNKFLFKMDELVITNVEVFYDNKFHQLSNAPIAVSLKVSFMETKILTQKDFTTPDELNY